MHVATTSPHPRNIGKNTRKANGTDTKTGPTEGPSSRRHGEKGTDWGKISFVRAIKEMAGDETINRL